MAGKVSHMKKSVDINPTTVTGELVKVCGMFDSFGHIGMRRFSGGGKQYDPI